MLVSAVRGEEERGGSSMRRADEARSDQREACGPWMCRRDLRPASRTRHAAGCELRDSVKRAQARRQAGRRCSIGLRSQAPDARDRLTPLRQPMQPRPSQTRRLPRLGVLRRHRHVGTCAAPEVSEIDSHDRNTASLLERPSGSRVSEFPTAVLLYLHVQRGCSAKCEYDR